MLVLCATTRDVSQAHARSSETSTSPGTRDQMHDRAEHLIVISTLLTYCNIFTEGPGSLNLKKTRSRAPERHLRPGFVVRVTRGSA
jgi:hypothetical protein